MNNKINDLDSQLGQKIRQRRRALKYNQNELAKALGITFQQLQKYEKGINRVPFNKLQILCKFLQVDTAWLFE